MSHTPHQLAADFPDLAGKLHELRESDPHFAHLVAEYDKVNDVVHKAETNLEPMDDLALDTVRKERVRLKDEIYAYLTR
ncbi:YdcH family protein [Roseixanthobacter glucoisosaccharinicivorans]|uniref:YdcH family protein n=1 Tax=Roseixanthobacter glucoisosaccharinicivorans TaxID=3119923 RepID=UPI00372704FA